MKHVRFLAFFCVFTLLFSSFFMPSASDNDARFSTYVNMGKNAVENGYAIPNLFRQDGVYSNIQRFPLVVKNGVEYVPLSVFILYSDVEVSYSKTSENFFLVNNKNNHYISFNVKEGVASTHDGDLLKLPVLIFNKTSYIPARTVAVVLGFSCETYDDPQTGIYAFRVSDGKSQKTLSQLLTPYIESNKELIEPLPPIIEVDPLEDIAERRVSICYANASYGDMETLLGVLDWYKVKASFSVTKEDILDRTNLVRQMFVSGHSLLVTAPADGNTAKECAQSFVEGLDGANDALVKTLRRKTRMCTLPFELSEEFANHEDFVSVVENAGYVILRPNVDTGDGPNFAGGAYSISAKIKNKIIDGFEEDEKATVTALVWCSDKTAYYTADVANLMNKYKQHKFCSMNEALLVNS
ncbi:MAG: hypothetical protein IJZ20_02970 [Clostridia bacterium]|nr:hypothetical protein [Clostridia bacterium]MBQ8758632.1 hypothetical protein [Clostridia bacterium]